MLDLPLEDLTSGLEDEARLKHCGTEAPHDAQTMYLSLFLCVGVVVSYLPQHIRIIKNKTGEGISTGYLLLGATSSACALLNIITLQFGIIRCCRVWSAFGCFENILGILQIFLQWLMFNIILVLFIYYWPSRLKYAFVTPIDHSRSHTQTPHRSNASTPPGLSTRMIRLFWPSAADQIFVGESTPSVSRTSHQRTVSDSSASSVGLGSPGNSYYTSNPVLLPSMTHKSQVTWTAEYRHAIAVAILVGLHLVVSIFITFLLLILSPKYRENDPADPEHPGYPHNHSTKLMLSWATVLGLLAMCLAAVQYVPQLWHTWSTRLVGSLSIPTMLIQTPGSFVFVYSYIAGGGRPGTNWTTWLVFLVTGSLQGVLLVMCCMWKLRQQTIGVDDYGNDLSEAPINEAPQEQDPLLGLRRGEARRTA